MSGPPLYPYRRSPDQDAATPVRHPVVVVGAGPVGLCLAIDLAVKGTRVLVLDDNDRVSTGSRAICFAKRTLEILDRLGVDPAVLNHGVQWSRGKVFAGEGLVYAFDLLPEAGHKWPAFINLQQYHLETALVARLRALEAAGAPVEIRGRSRVTGLDARADGARLTVDTPEGPYALEADWVIACDGANSPLRAMAGLGFTGRVFEDNFLIADVRMQAEFPTERWFWFDPPFNPGQSALLHKQPDGIWRIDLQLGRGIDREAERQPERVIPRLKAMLGEDVPFELEWVSVYVFQCRRMERFRHGRLIVCGDAAHQVSPFGARGANSGIQDADNLGWKLAAVLAGTAGEALLDSYDAERVVATDENIAASTRSTDFITPKSETSRLFRDAVLALARTQSFARPLVNSGRLSVPTVLEASPLGTADGLDGGPYRSRPGTVCPDAPLVAGFLVDRLGGHFTLLLLGEAAGGRHAILPPWVRIVEVADPGPDLRDRLMGDCPGAAYLVRPDGHIAARQRDAAGLDRALARALAAEAVMRRESAA